MIGAYCPVCYWGLLPYCCASSGERELDPRLVAICSVCLGAVLAALQGEPCTKVVVWLIINVVSFNLNDSFRQTNA